MKPTIVVVDDAPMMLRLVGRHLETIGVKALTCHNSVVAYHLIAQVKPCLVILDVSMPEVDGIDIFQQMRSDPFTRAIPVIFLTASDEMLWERLPNFEALGAHLFSKLSLARLPERVQQLLVSPAVPERMIAYQ